jgi:hypothetical protein
VVDDVGTDRRRLLELLFAEHRFEMIELGGRFRFGQRRDAAGARCSLDPDFCERRGVLITGSCSSGAAPGNSVDEVSPISIGMVAGGGCTIDPVSSSASRSVSLRSVGRPATLGAAGAASARAGVSGSSRNWFSSAAPDRGLHNGEEYAAYWENPKHRQHRRCLIESDKTPKLISIDVGPLHA